MTGVQRATQRSGAQTEQEDSARPQTLEQALMLLQQREQELQTLRCAQDEWVHAISHDLRAPLRHVLSFGPMIAELLQAQPVAAEELADAREFLQIMSQSARRMGGMLDGLLQLSRANRHVMQWQPVDIGGMLQRLQSDLSRRADVQGRAIEWQWPAQYPPVRADAQLLEQALQAVLCNAVKFTRKVATARIAVTVELHADQGWTLSIADNGSGFDSLRAGKLFGIFQRMHKDSEFEGVGTGLALVRAICRRHGGEAVIEARPGEGCVVSLHWPGGLVRGLA